MEKYDIKNWSSKLNIFNNYYKHNFENELKIIRNIKVDCIKVYSIFKLICSKPNGIFSSVSSLNPIDDFIWWDFVIESDKGFIHVRRTNKQLEVSYLYDDENFNIFHFINYNANKYKNEIEELISCFERHTVYINHYKSYLNTVKYFKNEINKIKLNEPTMYNGHIDENVHIEKYLEELSEYTENLMLFHPISKSLLLNTAFMVESFINLVIRIGFKDDIKEYDFVQKKYLNFSFNEKISCVKLYTRIFVSDIDLNRTCVKNILKLMSVRNKYVHFDEFSKINIISDEYYDNLYPLFNVPKNTLSVDLLNKIYLKPSKDEVLNYYNSAFEFIEYILTLIEPRFLDDVKSILNISPLSFNNNKKVYSSIYPSVIKEFIFK